MNVLNVQRVVVLTVLTPQHTVSVGSLGRNLATILGKRQTQKMSLCHLSHERRQQRKVQEYIYNII